MVIVLLALSAFLPSVISYFLDKKGVTQTPRALPLDPPLLTVHCFFFLFLQFGLVCSRGSLGFLSTSMIFAGFMAGSLCVSTISDKFGRRLPLFVCGFLCSLFNFVSAFAPVFWVFALFRAIVGFMIGKSSFFLSFFFFVSYCC